MWRRQRRLSNPAFRRAAVEGYGACMVRGAGRLFGGDDDGSAPLSPWERTAAAAEDEAAGGGAVLRDVYADFNALTLEVALEALFGLPSSGRADDGEGGAGAAGEDDADAEDNDKDAAELGARVVSAVERAFRYFAVRGATPGGLPPLPEWVPSPQNAEFAAAVRDLDALVYGIVAGRRRGMADGVDPASSQQRKRPTDLLQGLLDASAQAAAAGDGGGDDDEGGMDDRALRDELMTLLVAGQETSAIALGWACALLASDPEVQSWAAEGARDALTTQGGRLRPPASADAFSGALARVEAVVLEALRLWSPAYMVGRCAARDVELCALPPRVSAAAGAGGEGPYFERAWAAEEESSSSSPSASAAASLALIERDAVPGAYRIPKGTTVLVSPYLLHRDPRWWGGARDAAAFRPQRWLELASSSSSSGNGGGPLWPAALRDLGPNGAYVPFGAGPRVCIGTGFAMMEAVLVLSALLVRFELAPPPADAQGGPPPFPRPAAVLTLRPEAVPLRVRRRRW